MAASVSTNGSAAHWWPPDSASEKATWRRDGSCPPVWRWRNRCGEGAVPERGVAPVLTGALLAEFKTRAVERVTHGDPWDEREYEMYPCALRSP